ncbi:MAG: plastocyanin/azurin family copper-binding protein [Myxococcota bacterium]
MKVLRALVMVTILAWAGAAHAAEVVIEGDDMLKFDVTEFTVKAGESVKLTLKHVGQMPKVAMGHNLVILTAGTDVDAFAAAAVMKQDTEYFPEDQADKVVARTKLVGGGESDTIEFTAPAPGTYPYLCTFPGHNVTMRGVMTVE